MAALQKFRKNKFRIMTILVLIWTSSTYVIYHHFLSRLDIIKAYGWFSLFALMATVYAIYSRAHNVDNKKTFVKVFQKFSTELIKADKKAKQLIIASAVLSVFSFALMLSTLKYINPFIVVLFGIIHSLANILIGMAMFNDRVRHIISFFVGFVICLAGIIIFSFNTNEFKSSNLLITILILREIAVVAEWTIKTKLRRHYGLDPEKLMILPYILATVIGFTFSTGPAPNFTELLTLAYIGIVPTAYLGFKIQRATDILGAPEMSILNIPFVAYVWMVQYLLFFVFLFINQLTKIELLEVPILSKGQILASLLAVSGVAFSLYFGQPVMKRKIEIQHNEEIQFS